MPKFSKPMQGVCADEFLGEIKDQPSSTDACSVNGYHLFLIHSTAAQLQNLVNKDVCLSDSQTHWIVESMAQTIFEQMCKTQELAMKSKNPDIVNEATQIAITIQFATMINTMRLECHDCLNANCKFRDPNYPVKKVKERAEKMNTYWIDCNPANHNRETVERLIATAEGDVEKFKQLYEKRFCCKPSIYNTMQLTTKPISDNIGDDITSRFLQINQVTEEDDIEDSDEVDDE